MPVTVSSPSSAPPNTKRGAIMRRFKTLEDDRTSWRNHWQELSDYLLPRRGRYLLNESQNTRGRKRNNKIIDSTATQALRTLSAGMMSGMTNPSRPWFRFAVSSPELMEQHDVKSWLSDVERIVRNTLNKSNFYNTAPLVYTELGGFGTAALYRQRSPTTTIRFRPFTAGEYVVAEDDTGKVDTLGRSFSMTVSQTVEKFIIDKATGTADWKKGSKALKSLWDKKNYDALVPVVHMIQPRRKPERDLDTNLAVDMPIKSAYMESGAEEDKLLQESGYRTFPAYVPRWDVLSGDVYGRSPGMDALGDIKQLQHEQKRKAQAIDKMVNPPMTAPTSLRGRASSVIAGSTTYVDQNAGGQGFVPAYLVSPRIGELMQDIQEVQERIQRGFYADLFAMLINSDRRQITATEVAERHEEKLVLLGPVLQRLNIEFLDPMLDDVFLFLMEAGLLPPPPQALEGIDLRVEYISLLAQAQQAVAASGLERTMSFAGNLVGVFPSIVDNIDSDAVIREYSDILGNTPTIIVPRDIVEQGRAAAAAAAAQAQAQEQASQLAQGAKTLSEADTQNPNALTALLGRGESTT